MKNKRGLKLLITPLQGAKYVQNFLFYLVIHDIITVHALIPKGFFCYSLDNQIKIHKRQTISRHDYFQLPPQNLKMLQKKIIKIRIF